MVELIESYSEYQKDIDELVCIYQDYEDVLIFLQSWLSRSMSLINFICYGINNDVYQIKDLLNTPNYGYSLFNLHHGVDTLFTKDTARACVYFRAHVLNDKQSNIYFSKNKYFTFSITNNYEHNLIAGGEVGRVKASIPKINFEYPFIRFNNSINIDPAIEDLRELLELRVVTLDLLDKIEEIEVNTKDFEVTAPAFQLFTNKNELVELFKDREEFINFCNYTKEALLINYRNISEFLNSTECNFWAVLLRNSLDNIVLEKQE